MQNLHFRSIKWKLLCLPSPGPASNYSTFCTILCFKTKWNPIKLLHLVAGLFNLVFNLRVSFVVFACLYMCMYEHGWGMQQVHVHVDRNVCRVQSRLEPQEHCIPSLRQSFSMPWRLPTRLNWPVSPSDPPVSTSTPLGWSLCLELVCKFWTLTQVLVYASQVLYQLSQQTRFFFYG